MSIVARFLSYKQRPSRAREDTLPNGISQVSPAVNHCFAHGTWNHAIDRCCKTHHCHNGLLPLRVAQREHATIAPSSQVPFRFAPATGRAPRYEELADALSPSQLLTQLELLTTAAHAAHESHVRAALEKLKLLGASDRQIATLRQAEQINPNLIVPAPINGVVLTRNANLGLVANTAQELFTVADLSTVWVMASVNEKDFAAVHVGSQAKITASPYPGRNWNGRVTYIQPQVDPTTRTAQARIEVANPGETLRIEMYVDVEFAAPGATGPIVPEAAVQSIGERRFVFLPVKDEEGSFALRRVRLGPAASGYYYVLEGLHAQDEVVTDGSFILKAESIRQHPELH
jgi:RND family efflux transporter MFP subunit